MLFGNPKQRLFLQTPTDVTPDGWGSCWLPFFPGNLYQDASGNNGVASLAGSIDIAGNSPVGPAIQMNRTGHTQWLTPFNAGTGSQFTTLSCWVNFSNFANAYNTPLELADSGVGSRGLWLYVKSTGKLAIYALTGASPNYDGTGINTLSTGIWYHLACSYDTVNGGVGYVNGVVDGTFAPGASAYAASPQLRVGWDSASGGTARDLNGYISDVRVWPRTLTAQEVNRLYRRSLAFPLAVKEDDFAVSGLTASVELAGNLGGISPYGKALYGKVAYSRVAAMAPAFGADLRLAPNVNLFGGISPSVTLSGDLYVSLKGNLSPNIVLAASSFVSEPLWQTAATGAPPWIEAEPCPPSLWTPTEPCAFVGWKKAELCQ